MKNINVLNRFINWSWIVLILSSIFQLIFFYSWVNLVAILCVASSWFLITKYLLRRNLFNNFLLSSFIILGFVATQLFFPLVFTLLERKPIIFNLDLPNEVFVHSLLIVIVLLVAHLFYRTFFRQYSDNIRVLLSKFHFYEPPSSLQLWLMGGIGMLSMFYIYYYSPSAGQETSGAGNKFIQGLIPFTYSPYFLFVSQLYGKDNTQKKNAIVKILIFTVVLFIISIGSNIRSAFMLGFTSLGFAFVIGVLLGVFSSRIFTFKNLIIGAFLFWIFTGPIADLGTAMVIARSQLNNFTSRTDLLAYTVDIFNDKETIESKRLEGHIRRIDARGEWDEYYVDNIFLAKFCNLKFNDASLVDASKIDEYNPAVLNYTTDRIWAILPEPILDFIGVNVDKKTVNFSSFGDYLYYTSGRGSDVNLGGKRTGHLVGSGMAAFGWWYLLILGLGIIPVFVIVDAFFVKLNLNNMNFDQSKFILLRFSFCGLLALTSLFQFLPAESVIIVFNYLFRGWLQMVILYYIIFRFTRFISLLFK